MALICVVSAGGAPGTTTTAVALTLAWPRPVLLAECDTDGGSVLAGLFGGYVRADRGLLPLAVRLAQEPAAGEAALAEQVMALDEDGQRPVLAGPGDPFQAQAITPQVWGQVAELLASRPGDVLADVGQVRAAGYPFAVLAAAQLIVMVVRPTFRQIAAAKPRLEAIRQAFNGDAPLGLCVIGHGDYPVPEITRALGGGFGAVVQLPFDAKTAARLSDGVPTGRRDTRVGDLLVQARGVARRLRAVVDATARQVEVVPQVYASAGPGGEG